MEEVVVPVLSSSSVFNSKQWEIQQHDLLLIQQRQQLEQLKKEQEELKSRLRRYGKTANSQSAQQSTKYIPVTQPAPHQPVATLSKPVPSNNLCTENVKHKQKEFGEVCDKIVDMLTDENCKVTDEVNHKTEITNTSDSSSNDKDTGNGDPPYALAFNSESTSSVEATGDAQEVTATVSQNTISSSYDDERPIKPLQASNYDEVLDQQFKQCEGIDDKGVYMSHKAPAKKIFLHKGEGIARFGMKKLQLKGKSLQGTSETVKDNETTASTSNGSEHINKTVSSSTSAPVVSTVNSKASQINHQFVSSKHILDHQLLRFPSDDSFVVRQQKHCRKEVEDLEEFEMLEKAAENMSFSSQSSLVLRVIGKPMQIHRPSTSATPEQPDLSESSEESDSTSEDEQSANETLRAVTPPVVFDDEEAWESCSHSSLSNTSDNNPLTSSVEELGHPLVASTPPIKEKLIAHNSEHNSNVQSVLNEPIKSLEPEIPAQVVVTAGQEAPETKVTVAHPTAIELSQKATTVSIPSLPSPPTSNLVKKLFPLLNSEKQVGTASTSSAKKEESPKTISLKEELETKRCQLEIEIDRFKRENAAISKLRMERDENLKKLREEISDFQRQRAEEIEQFEEYKKEEIKKLKKERKVFETYQKQLLAKPNRKERQEIEALRDELRQTQEEMKTKESRWGASLARYRLRIETLETQNKELQNDLHMMEQERLKQWQLQFNERKKVSSKACQVELTNLKPKELNVSSIACQVDLPSLYDNPATLPVTSNEPLHTEVTSFSETNSVDTSLLSENGDIITIVTADRVTASVLHADTDTSSISVDQEEDIVTPLCSPTNSKQPADNIVTVENIIAADNIDIPQARTGDGSNKKSVRFQDSLLDHSAKPIVLHSNSTAISPDKAVVVDEDGSQVITFPNGTRKVINTDGSTSIYFFNGDSKQIKPDNTVIYYYAESDTTHTTFPDGLSVFHFTNNQVEKHYPDGRKEVTFSDGTIRYIHPNGGEECCFENGTIQKVQPDGNHTIEFPNGQKEIYTKEFKSREYPDGTVKTVYSDGRQETRYSSGRIRIKDKNGNLIIDKFEATKR